MKNRKQVVQHQCWKDGELRVVKGENRVIYSNRKGEFVRYMGNRRPIIRILGMPYFCPEVKTIGKLNIPRMFGRILRR